MYFGLNSEGLIDTHIFDKKISNMTPQRPVQVAYPWLRPDGSEWKPELVPAMNARDVGTSDAIQFDLVEVMASLEKEEGTEEGHGEALTRSGARVVRER